MVVLNPVGRSVGCTRPTLGVGLLQLRLRLIWDELDLHAPQNAAPRHVRFSIAQSSIIIGLSFALAAYEADRLTVPIIHEVKRNAARQVQRQCRGELKKAVAKVGRNYVLMGHRSQLEKLGWGMWGEMEGV
jgi:hypothetical protein